MHRVDTYRCLSSARSSLRRTRWRRGTNITTIITKVSMAAPSTIPPRMNRRKSATFIAAPPYLDITAAVK